VWLAPTLWVLVFMMHCAEDSYVPKNSENFIERNLARNALREADDSLLHEVIIDQIHRNKPSKNINNFLANFFDYMQWTLFDLFPCFAFKDMKTTFQFSLSDVR